MLQLLEIHSGSNQARFHNFKEGNDDSSALAVLDGVTGLMALLLDGVTGLISVPGGQTRNCRLPGRGSGRLAHNSRANPPRSVIKKKNPVGPQCLYLLILAKNAVDQDRDPVAAVRSAL